MRTTVPCSCISCMRTIGTITHGSQSSFLNHLVAKCLAIRMLCLNLVALMLKRYSTHLTEPDCLRCTILESNHSVFPISYMITKILLQYGRAIIVGVEVHIEGVNATVPTIVHDDS